MDGAPSEGCSTTTNLAQLSIESDAGAGAVHIITLSFSTCQSPRSAIFRHIEINDLSEHSIGKMVSSSPLLNYLPLIAEPDCSSFYLLRVPK
jgi:hypothetical protein